MTRNENRSNLSPLLLEKLALGELAAADQAKIDRLLSVEEQRQAVQVLERSNVEILAKLPPKTVAQNVHDRLLVMEPGSPTRAKSRSGAIVAVLAMAACLALTVIWRNRSATTTNEIPDVLLKGQTPHLLIYRKVANGSERLKAGDVARAGETLQVRYVAAGYQYGVILSIEGHGQVTLHYPTTPTEANSLKNNGEMALPFAYELDDAPDFERFLFVASKSPLSVPELIRQAQTMPVSKHAEQEPLALPEDEAQFSLIIRKPSP